MDIPKDEKCVHFHSNACQNPKHCNYMRRVNGMKTCKKEGNIGKMEIRRDIDVIL